MNVPTKEPSSLRAGDTWKWRRENLNDYPASTWTLKYRFKNAAGGFEVVAEADGDNFSVLVAAATTSEYAAGNYSWVAWVELDDEKYTVDQGSTLVLQDLRGGDAEAALDTRTHARKVLEAIEAVIEKRANLDQRSYTIEGRSLERTPIPELLVLRDRYRQEVRNENTATALGSRRIGIRFSRI